jgi:hypothetical protein
MTAYKRTPAWRRLLAPLRYISIKHEMKWHFDFKWPLIMTLITMALFAALPIRPPIFGETGVIKGIREIISLFAAFFVVALAAVATFARPSLDKPMEGTTPTLYGVGLTRRQFVCYLFGYLAFISFALFIAAILGQILAPALGEDLSKNILWWVKAIGGSIFTFVFWNMAITTLLGIYFLVERVHLDDKDNGNHDNPTEIRDRKRRRAA